MTNDFFDKTGLLMVLLGIIAIFAAGAYLTYLIHWSVTVIYISIVMFCIGALILTAND